MSHLRNIVLSHSASVLTTASENLRLRAGEWSGNEAAFNEGIVSLTVALLDLPTTRSEVVSVVLARLSVAREGDKGAIIEEFVDSVVLS